MPARVHIFVFVFVFAFVCGQNNYRLPQSVLPVHYDLTVNTNFNSSSFKGEVSITINALERTNTITLYSKDLNVTNIRLVNSATSVTANSVSQQMDFLELRFTNYLVINQSYVLTMEFSGGLRSDGIGFFQASYMDEQNITRYLAATHFESTYARSVFPCFDEPNLKATFRISLVRDTIYSTVSNMNQTANLPYFGDPNKIIDVYAVSPKLPTYLVAFAVLDYTKVSDGAFFVYGRKKHLDQGNGAYALGIGKRAIEIMRNLTAIDYMAPKIDQVAIPNEKYGFDAAGNLGLMTYRERNLMYNEQNLTVSEKQQIGMTIARGIAHQWFGNLVTPQWWKYIWLSEGFATYYSVLLIDQLEPNWSTMQQFITLVMQSALEIDAIDSTRPMTRDANTPLEIEALYDTISSNKAASVIRMVSVLLGEKVFRAGITSYLTKWQLDNVEPANLYQCWQEALGNATVNLTQILQTWETQAGYPVVTVTRDYETYTTLSQKRFRLNVNATDDGTRWIIPVSWFSSDITSNGLLMLSSDTNLTLNIPAQDWIVVNYNREGFYRVAYDEINWMLLTHALFSNLTMFRVQNRAQFIDDAFNLARAGLIDYHVAFDIGKYIAEEEEYAPIAAFTSAIGYLDRITRGTVHNSYIREYGIQILEKIYVKLGFEFLSTDPHMKKLIRGNVLTSLCDLGHKECNTKSLDAFLAWSDYGVTLQPDSQAVILCNALRNRTNSGHWATIYTAYFDSQDDNERSRLATAFGCIAYDLFLKESLILTLISGLDFNTVDRVLTVTSVLSNNEVMGVNLVLDFLTSNFTAANEIIGSMPMIIKDVASRISTEYLLDKFKNFVKDNEVYFSDSLKATVSIAMADAEYNLRWLRDMTPQFDSYFSSPTEAPGDGDDGVARIMLNRFYRVAYDEINWMLLTDALLSNLTIFPVQNRAQFIDDAFNLARAGLLDYHVAFDIGKYIAEEEEYAPIAAFTSAIGYLDRITRGTVHNSNMREYGIQILEKIYVKLGFEFLSTDPHMKKLIRGNVLTSLCDLGHNECNTKSLDAFLAWSDYGVILQPDSQAIILCNAIRNTTNSGHWAIIYNAYFKSQDDNERSRIASALGCLGYDVFLNQSLIFALISELDFNTVDRVLIVTSVLSNNEVMGVNLVLDFLTSNFAAANEIIGSMPMIIKDVASRISTEDLLDKFKNFVKDNEVYFSDSLKTTVSIAMAEAEYNLRWLREMSPQFDSYFSSPTEAPGDGDDGVARIMLNSAAAMFTCLVVLLNY